jgi:hypothetical protein
MHSRQKLFLMTIAIFSALVLGSGAGLCTQPCNTCDNLQDLSFSGVTITSATLVSGTTVLPEHCRIEGVRYYDQFIIKLPTNWNDRYYQVGNGGAAGEISESGIDEGLTQGYVAASGSGGHTEPFPMFTFAYPPTDPAAQQKVDDYCYGSVHETMLLAKMFMAAYYCDIDGPDYAYYNSCSTGGRQGLIEVQRYPEDFDGLLIGAPVHYLTQITTRGVWAEQQLTGAGAIDPIKMPLLANAVMNECDDIDGLVDGLIDDPRNCTFDAMTDLPACPGDVDDVDCFTTAQRQAIYNIYDGPRKTDGTRTTFGEAFGSEALAPGPFGPSSGWMMWILQAPPMPFSLGFGLGGGFVQWAGLPPSGGGGATWDYMTFDFDTDFDTVVTNMSDKCDAMDPDLSTFKALGGKLIHYDGWADPATGPYQTADYYENVLNTMGDAETKEFYRLYMIPGMAHCGGGLGCFDGNALFDALVDWVENGNEPTSYTGAGVTAAGAPRTRPMCPYPEVAVYSGSGSIDDAANFTCQDLTPPPEDDTPPPEEDDDALGGCFINAILGNH